MPSTRPLRTPLLAVLVASLVLAPAPASAAEPTLGEAVTLPDGSVLPEMPADLIRPSVQSEQLAEHAGTTAAGTEGELTVEPLANAGTIAQVVEPLAATAGAVGPAGPLPNGLRREVLGFLPYWKLDSTTRASLRLDLMSTIAYFSVGVQPNGYLARGTSAVPTVGWSGWTSPAMTELINAAHARGVRVVPTITMMAWDYDYTDMATLLNSASYRARLAADVVTMVRDRRVDGVNIDFEPVPSSLRAQFTALVREINAGLVNAKVGSYVTVDTMAGAATWSSGYDVVGLTASGAADALMVMAYDFHYAGSSRAGGVAPIESDHIFASADAMRDHLAKVSPSKLIWGVPYYGRAWNTTTAAVNSPVRSPAQSVAFSYYWNDGGTPAGGKVLGQKYGRKWDATGQVPWFVFTDAGSGGYRQGYYEDPASLRVKYNLVNARDLAGIGIWSLGMDTGVNDLWNVIEDRFVKVQVRVAGANRYDTAAALSRSAFSPGVPVAYVATGTSFPDALAGGPAAARTGGPMLLTTPNELPSATAAELARLKPSKIVVLGGTSAVSAAVANRLAAYATTGVVQRLSGADRYATAARVSAATFAPGVAVAYVATGASFPDALAGGVAAGRQGGPVLLVAKNALPAATAGELGRLKAKKIIVLGGTSAVSDGVLATLRSYTAGGVTRLSGADRYATAVAVSRASTGPDAPRTVYIATGAAFPDGLAATPIAARGGGPLLIVPPSGLTDVIRAELRRLNPPRVVIVGGTSVVSATVANQIAALWD
ncbi:MAG TPA: cell wall-binding repeat-containing protein [Patescibacteria group bacterium]|nr:cell wall-binding repeat-containing protein [Patescibacteria group bacterium]